MSRRGLTGTAIFILMFAGGGTIGHALGAESESPAFAKLNVILPNDVLAQAAAAPNDPPLCPTAADPTEQPLGGFTSKAPLSFPAATVTKDLYSRLIVTIGICTDKTLSSADRSALEKVLNTLGISAAKTFSSLLSVTFNAAGGPRYPSILPFAYSFDESKGTYVTQTSDQVNLPWQTTSSGYSISFNYNANSKVAIGTVQLAAGILTAVEGANPSTSLVSQATSNYINVGATIIDQVAASALADSNTTTHTTGLDIVTNLDRGMILPVEMLGDKGIHGEDRRLGREDFLGENTVNFLIGVETGVLEHDAAEIHVECPP